MTPAEPMRPRSRRAQGSGGTGARVIGTALAALVLVPVDAAAQTRSTVESERPREAMRSLQPLARTLLQPMPRPPSPSAAAAAALRRELAQLDLAFRQAEAEPSTERKADAEARLAAVQAAAVELAPRIAPEPAIRTDLDTKLAALFSEVEVALDAGATPAQLATAREKLAEALARPGPTPNLVIRMGDLDDAPR